MARIGAINAEVFVLEQPTLYNYMLHLEALIRENTELRVYTHHLEILVKENVGFYALLVTMC